MVRRPRIEAMLTMTPGRFAATQRLPAVCATSQAPRRLVSTTASQSSSGISSAGFTMEMPALFTTMSIGPSAVSAASNAAFTDLPDCTSSSTAAALLPAFCSSACRDLRRSARRAAIATDAPAAASVRAKWTPRPDEAPVTSTTLPERSNRLDIADAPLFDVRPISTELCRFVIQIRPHPEEPHEVRRLEGWATIAVYPILRDARLRRAPQDEVVCGSAAYES